jgi:hypothetical protein
MKKSMALMLSLTALSVFAQTTDYKSNAGRIAPGAMEQF